MVYLSGRMCLLFMACLGPEKSKVEKCKSIFAHLPIIHICNSKTHIAQSHVLPKNLRQNNFIKESVCTVWHLFTNDDFVFM